MKTSRFPRALLVAAASLVLAACGGGGSAPQDTNMPPASASQSSQGFLAYIASLANGMYDTAEPVDISAFSAPTDDTAMQEPAATSIDQAM